jgi:hypothetical protein
LQVTQFLLAHCTVQEAGGLAGLGFTAEDFGNDPSTIEEVLNEVIAPAKNG